MQRKDLERLSREELVAQATALGVVRPRALTIPELIDEIIRVSEKGGRPAGRGWFGRARDLLTSVIDRGLSLPDARARRSEGRAIASPPPLPTVTLAEIYAAQGHVERAIATLDEVLARDAGHAGARDLRARLEAQLQRRKPSTPPPVVEARLETMPPPPPPGLSRADEAPAPTGADAEPAPEAAPPAAASAPAAEAAPPAPTPAAAAAAPDAEEAHDLAEEIDEVVALAVDPHTVYLYWEVRAETLSQARAEHPEGSLVVRAVTVVPGDLAHGGGPRTDVRDVRVDALVGELFLEGLPAQANVRVSVGFKRGAGSHDGRSEFLPFAVGVELATPREAPLAVPAQTFRRFSEPRSPLARPHDPIERAFRRGGTSPLRGELEGDLLARFPGGVWIDPATSVAQVALPSGERVLVQDTPSGRELVRPAFPGSSDLVRQRVAWSSQPVIWRGE